MKKKVLFVIDMLNDFVDPKGTLYIGPAALPLVRNVKELVRDFDGQKYFLCDNHQEDDKEFERFPKHAVAGGWGQAIIDDLMDMTIDIVIPKTRYSGFYHTNLERDLLLRGYNPANSEIIIVGDCTSICVMYTAADLVNRDYNVIIPENCVADFDQEAHEFTLKHMKNVLGVNII